MPDSTTFHPVHNVYDGLFNAASGKKISIHDPQPHMIDIKDIAAALSKICRFGGQINAFYSVAQHSVLVAAMAPEPLKKAALLHDAAEAYLGDVIKPLKVVLGGQYEALEVLFDEAISVHFGIDLIGTYEAVKEYDRMALELEHEALQKGNMAPMMNALTTYGLLMKEQWTWDHQLSRTLFMVTFNDLFKL